MVTSNYINISSLSRFKSQLKSPVEQSCPLSQPRCRLRMAPCVTAHTPHTSAGRLKAVGSRVGLIASIQTDPFNLQSQPGGEHKLSRKSHKEHFFYLQQFYSPTCLLFSHFSCLLYSYVILFWFLDTQKSKIWTKAIFSLATFHIQCKTSDKRSRKPTVQTVLLVTVPQHWT